MPAKETAGLDETHFIQVELEDSSGKTIDDMIYWRSSRDPGYGCDGPFTALNAMPPARVHLDTSVQTRGRTQVIHVALSNPGKSLAFFIRLKILGEASRKLIRPCFYSDNGFSILPGERKAVDIEIETEVLAGEHPQLAIEGWNIGSAAVEVPGRLSTPRIAALGKK